MAEICPECGAAFGSAADLVEHARTGHPHTPLDASVADERPSGLWFRCALCGARFRSPLALAAHNSRPHSTSKRLPLPGRPFV